MKITKNQLRLWLKEELSRERGNMREAKTAGVNSPGFNQSLGAHDAYQKLLDMVDDNAFSN